MSDQSTTSSLLTEAAQHVLAAQSLILEAETLGCVDAQYDYVVHDETRPAMSALESAAKWLNDSAIKFASESWLLRAERHGIQFADDWAMGASPEPSGRFFND